jgi:hypothetical protein
VGRENHYGLVLQHIHRAVDMGARDEQHIQFAEVEAAAGRAEESRLVCVGSGSVLGLGDLGSDGRAFDWLHLWSFFFCVSGTLCCAATLLFFLHVSLVS